MHTLGYLGEILNPVSNGGGLEALHPAYNQPSSEDAVVPFDIDVLTKRPRHTLGAAALYDVVLDHIRETHDPDVDTFQDVMGATLPLDSHWEMLVGVDPGQDPALSMLGDAVTFELRVIPTAANPTPQELIRLTPDTASQDGWEAEDKILDKDQTLGLLNDLRIAIAAYKLAKEAQRKANEGKHIIL